jgi:hypothetical protein
MRTITLESGEFGWDYILRCVETDQTRLIQTDWDYPGIATTFGWVACPHCNETDGTVNCKHRTASEMIARAQGYLDEKALGEIVADPGYFDTDGAK